MNILGETHYKDPDKGWRRAMMDDFIGECRVNWYAGEPSKVMFSNGYSKMPPFIGEYDVKSIAPNATSYENTANTPFCAKCNIEALNKPMLS